MKTKRSHNVTPKVSCKYGAPMGRLNVGVLLPCGRVQTEVLIDGVWYTKKLSKRKIYTKSVPLTDGYDRGGAYWGIGTPLMCDYTPCGNYRKYYRLGDK